MYNETTKIILNLKKISMRSRGIFGFSEWFFYNYIFSLGAISCLAK